MLCALALSLWIAYATGCSKEKVQHGGGSKMTDNTSSFAGDLNGNWKIRLPAGAERDVELIRTDNDHYRFLSKGMVFNGVYQVRSQRLVMDKPDDQFQNKFDDKYQWQIQNDKLLVLIDQPPAEKYGSNYLGTKLQKE